MHSLDLQVIQQALRWAADGSPVWLCTVLGTFGSAPRAPGSMLAVNRTGQWVGSLSGGCVEDDFIERIRRDEIPHANTVLRYGDDSDRSHTRLPCGGTLDILIEYLPAGCNVQAHLREMESALLGQRRLLRTVRLGESAAELADDDTQGPKVERNGNTIVLRLGAVQRLILAGYSAVAHACAEFARAVGFEVILCEPRDDVLKGVQLEHIEIQRTLPSAFIAEGNCHADTAVVALTHDPRIDDLAMIEAVRTDAFYIGVMGSKATTAKRFERLARVGGLSQEELARIHAPIGLNLGSKTPAEIALAVVADLLRVRNGIAREAL